MTAAMSPNETIWQATLPPTDASELLQGTGALVHATPDVLVVGGGLVGLCCAWYLAERGARVQLIDAGPLAGAASAANAGGIWPNDQGPLHSEAFQPLAFESRDLWARLAVRPGFDFDWRVNGFLAVNAERIGPSAEAAASVLQERGFTTHAIDGEQLRWLEPELSTELKYGLHSPADAQIHPLKAAASLVRTARKRGAGISAGVSALRVEITGGKVQRVETTAGAIEPRHVIAATGWSAAWLKDALPTLPPLRPVSGQLIATAPQRRLIKAAIGGKFLIFQLPTGEVVTGGNVQESDQLTPDASLSETFASAARELIPALRDCPFDRAWCGIRPATPDGLPIIDRAPGLDNIWLACGHFRNGVLLAPATGKHLAEWIVGSSRPAALEGFSAGRFSGE